jgi:hypothetical protein
MLVRGFMIPLTTRFLVLAGDVPVAPLLRQIVAALAREFAGDMPEFDPDNRMMTYERRAELYVRCLSSPRRTNERICATVTEWLLAHDRAELAQRALSILAIDEAFAPRTGAPREITCTFDFAADRVVDCLKGMELPARELLECDAAVELTIHHRAGAGDTLFDPDGGMWMGGTLQSTRSLPGGVPAVDDAKSVAVGS